jgi:hypothetical protein
VRREKQQVTKTKLMFRRFFACKVRAGNVNPGIHSVRGSQLPYVPWPYDTRYCGKTAQAVIEKYKKPNFPMYKFPVDFLHRKVEEINWFADKGKNINAIEAMDLLTNPNYHNDKRQIN